MTDYTKMKLYIAVHDEVPDNMVPVVVAHAVLNAQLRWGGPQFLGLAQRWADARAEAARWCDWLEHSFKKVVVRVSDAEFLEITRLPAVYLGSEETVMGGDKCVAIPCPRYENEPVLRNAKLWAPKGV